MKSRKEKLIRTHNLHLVLNDRELKVLERYMSEHKIVNKSQFIREVLFSYILKMNEENPPSLFD